MKHKKTNKKVPVHHPQILSTRRVHSDSSPPSGNNTHSIFYCICLEENLVRILPRTKNKLLFPLIARPIHKPGFIISGAITRKRCIRQLEAVREFTFTDRRPIISLFRDPFVRTCAHIANTFRLETVGDLFVSYLSQTDVLCTEYIERQSREEIE
ncbi:hypothetical protein HNY73_001761 [Argiope bruennichi]|uniref:Uncharacterized protein n=1 Tax=Argiope bruennichi TaxID=94029 RepID=A0A8T0FSD5_ARGBR|nr:hypothetical protein HNY73_001761 [Argiope bruennichi]